MRVRHASQATATRRRFDAGAWVTSLSASSDGAIWNAGNIIDNPGLARRMGCVDDVRGTVGVCIFGRGTVGSQFVGGLGDNHMIMVSTQVRMEDYMDWAS